MITSIGRYFVGDPNLVSIVTTDDLAEITTAGYITAQQANIEAINNGEFQWQDTDLVLIYYATAQIGFFTHDTTNDSFAELAPPSGISSTLVSAHILVGSAGNVATDVAMSGDITISNTGVTAIGANKVLSAMVSPLLVKYTTVAVSAAEFNGMYAAPKLLLAAGGANTLIVVERAVLAMTYGAAQFADGGVVAIQYDSTINGAGAAASNTEAAADFFAAASTSFCFNGVSGNTVGAVPFATSVNKGLYLSNATGAFTTGDSTFVMHLWYKVIPTV